MIKRIILFKALSNETRLMIIDFLLDGEKCVCKIFPHVKKTQSTTSIELAKLKAWDLVRGRRDGKWIHYSIKDKATEERLRNLVRC